MEEGELPDYEIPTTAIPLPGAGDCGLSCRWGFGNSLALFLRPSAAAAPPAVVAEFGWKALPDALLPLLFHWHSIFLHVRRTLQHEPPLASSELEAELYHMSQRYRAELQALLQAEVEKLQPDTEGKETHWREQLQLLEIAKSLWHLCEISFIDPAENGTAQLVGWIQLGIPPPAELPQAHAALDSDVYWDVVFRLLTQGRTGEVSELLLKNPFLSLSEGSSTHTLTSQLVDMLETLPSRRAVEDEERSQDMLRRRMAAWRAQVAELRDHPAVRQHPQLDKLCALLLGDEEMLLHAAGSWYELFVAKLLFVCPEKKKTELPTFASLCLQHMGVEEPTALDSAVLAVLGRDVLVALRHVNALVDLPWFVAHLADLLVAVRPELLDTHMLGRDEEKEEKEDNLDVREFFVSDFVSSLLCQSELWQLAPAYLRVCPRTGLALLRTLLAHQQPTCPRVGLKLLNLCSSFDLSREATSILNQLGMAALRAGNWGAACNWFARAGNDARVESLCETVWVGFCGARCSTEEGARTDCSRWREAMRSVVENDTSQEKADGVAFLDVVVRFLANLDRLEADPSDANLKNETLALVIDAFQRQLLPMRSWLAMLVEVRPLLEDGAVLSKEATFMLLARLEEIAASPHAAYRAGFTATTIARLRLLLVKALANAVICAPIKPGLTAGVDTHENEF